jgi:hypothetical protein
MKHFFIPDTQCRPGDTYEHLTAAGNYVVDKQPDIIIHAGDHFDMPSLSAYDKGTKKAEGIDYAADIEAGQEGMEAFFQPIQKHNAKARRKKIKGYRPELYFLLGNHEQRIEIYGNANPEMHRKVSYKDLELEKFGWNVQPFLQPICLDGVYYAHYFYNPNTGRPLGGVAHTRLKNIGHSFTMGHQQGKDQAERYLSNGHVHRGLIAGSFYQHDEDYKGPQGNEHWRGCIMKHQVRDGNYDIMELSMSYLMEKWL